MGPKHFFCASSSLLSSSLLAMLAMKAKAMKTAMKSTMKRAMKSKRVAKIARGKRARSQVLKGKKEKTVGGLTSSQLMKNSYGKVVSKSASQAKKKAYAGS